MTMDFLPWGRGVIWRMDSSRGLFFIGKLDFHAGAGSGGSYSTISRIKMC